MRARQRREVVQRARRTLERADQEAIVAAKKSVLKKSRKSDLAVVTAFTKMIVHQAERNLRGADREAMKESRARRGV